MRRIYMIKKSFLIVSILVVSGCVGTIKIAKENGADSIDSTTATANRTTKLKD